MVKKTQRRKDPCVLTVRQEILNYASRTENTMKGLGYALIVGKIQQNLTKSYVMSAWVNFKIVIRKSGKHQSQNGGLCQRCRAYLKNYREKNRCDLSRSERPDYGICYICGKNPTMKGKKVCDKCYETRLSTLPAMWENANNDYFRQLNYARFCMIKNQRKEKTSGSDFNV